MAKDTHSFSVDVATEIGVPSAILLGHFRFLAKENAPREGKDWRTYGVKRSVASLRKVYPYLTDGIIRGALDQMEKGGYLIGRIDNEKKSDRTKTHYFGTETFRVFGDNVEAIPETDHLLNLQMDLLKSQIRFVKIANDDLLKSQMLYIISNSSYSNSVVDELTKMLLEDSDTPSAAQPTEHATEQVKGEIKVGSKSKTARSTPPNFRPAPPAYEVPKQYAELQPLLNDLLNRKPYQKKAPDVLARELAWFFETGKDMRWMREQLEASLSSPKGCWMSLKYADAQQKYLMWELNQKRIDQQQSQTQVPKQTISSPAATGFKRRVSV